MATRRPLITDDDVDLLILIPFALAWLAATPILLVWRKLRGR